VVARSSGETEFRAMAHKVCELLWMKILLKKELGYDYKDPMRLYCENKATINTAHNPVQHNQTKQSFFFLSFFFFFYDKEPLQSRAISCTHPFRINSDPCKAPPPHESGNTPALPAGWPQGNVCT